MKEANPNPDDEPKLFDAELAPNRSLTKQGFRVLMIVFAGICAAASLRFLALGAWPIVPFLILDVALLWFFIRLNQRAGRARERVTVTQSRLVAARIDPAGRSREWSFNPHWARLRKVEREEFGLDKLSIVNAGKELEIARVLGGYEKAEFANALQKALSEARKATG